MTSETEARRSVAITGAPLSAVDALDGRAFAVELDVRAEPRQLLHVHEAVLEDRLGDVRRALRPRHQRHELRLQVGREAGERRGRDLDRRDARAVARDPHAAYWSSLTSTPAWASTSSADLQQFGARVLQHHVAAGHGHRHGIGAGLDAVGQHAVARAVQLGHALDHDARGAGAGDLGAHLVEAVGDVVDLRLARGVLDHGRAVRERGRHQRGMGAADRHLGEDDLAAAQPFLARAMT